MALPSAPFFASELLRIGAVSLSPEAPFTWASGLKSPIYCDNRITLGYPALRRSIAQTFAERVVVRGWQPAVIAGTATAGIPHAAWLASELGLPMAYVRSKPKGHGRQNQIEGPLEAGESVVLIEDLISTGMSSMAAVDALLEAGAEVLGVLAIFSYGFPDAHNRFEDAGIPLETLTDYDALIAKAISSGHVDPGQRETLQAWQHDPAGWSARINS